MWRSVKKPFQAAASLAKVHIGLCPSDAARLLGQFPQNIHRRPAHANANQYLANSIGSLRSSNAAGNTVPEFLHRPVSSVQAASAVGHSSNGLKSLARSSSVQFKEWSFGIQIRGNGTYKQGSASSGPRSDASKVVTAAGVSGGGRPSPSRAAELAKATTQEGARKSKAMILYLAAMVIAMVGATYASVPLYRMFCQATGYGGTVKRRETVEEKVARQSQNPAADAARQRELVVQFNADVADGMPWRFVPSQREVKVRPGQSTLAFYTAHNLSDQPITGVSTYNVSPMKAGAYFNKVQCFCFEEQRLRAGEKIDMPVFFYIDPEFATDPKMDGINSITLSYTFFKVEDVDDVNEAKAA